MINYDYIFSMIKDIMNKSVQTLNKCCLDMNGAHI